MVTLDMLSLFLISPDLEVLPLGTGEDRRLREGVSTTTSTITILFILLCLVFFVVS